ncbi:uncharacterized protein B0H18DRAFT_1131360 [Fomitopsis serialis]|uniref:uncharacterized protein n=1 Tax=Fomitopsis serialis TaxID=139415 RepID=UPI002007ECCF|nr:uncharacterized protein B0H18DRAFT_1131360 [Neoantrodia serialis]KAH9908231.1 hypothetical protein B0H18DRAFT_1131360 [Neoantrodia serialis]
MASRYLKVLESWRSAIMDMVSSRIQHITASRRQSPTPPSKPPFKQAAVPILERVFQCNPRPTRAEKQQLAKQTDMEYKQINIWFQNRRSRSKKATPMSSHIEASQGSVSLPPDLAASLVRILDKYVVDAIDAHMHGAEEDMHAGAIPSFGPFKSERPQHAFPVCYPPLCSYDPFPIARDSRKLATPWFRLPTPSRKELACSDSSEEVLALLEQLTLREEGMVFEHAPPTHRLKTGSASTVGFTVLPPSAPLPALLRTGTCSQPDISVEPVRRCSQRYSPRATSSSTALPATLKMEASPDHARVAGRRASNKAKASRVSRARGVLESSAHELESLFPHSMHSPAILSAEPRHDGLANETDIRRPLSTEPFGQPYAKRRSSGRRAIALPKRTPKTLSRFRPAGSPTPSLDWSVSSSTSFAPSPSPSTSSPEPSTPSRSPSPGPMATLSRMSSLSSIRSVSSASSSSSDWDILLTPPLLPTSMPDILVSEDPSFGLYSDQNNWDSMAMNGLDDGYMDYSVSFSGAALIPNLSADPLFKHKAPLASVDFTLPLDTSALIF